MRRYIMFVAVLAMLASLLAAPMAGAQETSPSDPAAGQPPAAEPERAPAITERLAGNSRIGTAAAIAREAFPDGASVVYLARADVSADALAAGALTDGPVLLVPTCGEVPTEVADAITTLAPVHVFALGGEAAVCDEMLQAAAGSRETGRLAGDGRTGTAVAVAQRAFPGGAPEVYIAGAHENPDAVAGGALRGGPILLAGGGGVDQVTLEEIERLAAPRVVALGGTAAVSDEALGQASESAAPMRVAGPGRMETAVEISRYGFQPIAEIASPVVAGGDTVYLARADVFVDAVAGGSLSRGPILLVPSCGPLPAPVAERIQEINPSRIVALGGVGAICEDVVTEAGAHARAELYTDLETIISPDVVVVDEEAREAIVGVSDDGTTVAFDGAVPYQVGEIIVVEPSVDLPDGIVGRITATTQNRQGGGSATLAAVAITDMVIQGTLVLNHQEFVDEDLDPQDPGDQEFPEPPGDCEPGTCDPECADPGTCPEEECTDPELCPAEECTDPEFCPEEECTDPELCPEEECTDPEFCPEEECTDPELCPAEECTDPEFCPGEECVEPDCAPAEECTDPEFCPGEECVEPDCAPAEECTDPELCGGGSAYAFCCGVSIPSPSAAVSSVGNFISSTASSAVQGVAGGAQAIAKGAQEAVDAGAELLKKIGNFPITNNIPFNVPLGSFEIEAPRVPITVEGEGQASGNGYLMLQLQGGSPVYFQASGNVLVSLTATVTATASASLERELTIFETNLGRISGFIGPVPVWATPQLSLSAFAEIEASAGGEIELKASRTFERGIRWTRGNGWTTISNTGRPETSYELSPVLEAEASVGLELGFGIDIYGTPLTSGLVPGVAGKASLDAAFTPLECPVLDLSATLAAFGTFEVLDILPGIPKFEHEIASVTYPLYTHPTSCAQPTPPGPPVTIRTSMSGTASRAGYYRTSATCGTPSGVTHLAPSYANHVITPLEYSVVTTTSANQTCQIGLQAPPQFRATNSQVYYYRNNQYQPLLQFSGTQARFTVPADATYGAVYVRWQGYWIGQPTVNYGPQQQTSQIVIGYGPSGFPSQGGFTVYCTDGQRTSQVGRTLTVGWGQYCNVGVQQAGVNAVVTQPNVDDTVTRSGWFLIDSRTPYIAVGFR